MDFGIDLPGRRERSHTIIFSSTISPLFAALIGSQSIAAFYGKGKGRKSGKSGHSYHSGFIPSLENTFSLTVDFA